MALYDSVDMQIMLSVHDFGATGPPVPHDLSSSLLISLF